MTATVGKGKAKRDVAIAFIFIYSASYAIFFNTNYLVASEIVPFYLPAGGLECLTLLLTVLELWSVGSRLSLLI